MAEEGESPSLAVAVPLPVKEVSGTQESLAKAIEDGNVPRPGLLDWNAWQEWRSSEGKAPTRAADGARASGCGGAPC